MIEILEEIVREISKHPGLFVLELIQFLLLAGLLVFFIPRYLKKFLNDRKERIIEDLKRSEEAFEEHKIAEEEAKAIITRARENASQIIKEAEIEAQKEMEAIMKQAEEEVKDIIGRTKEAIDNEKRLMFKEMNEQLVSLIAKITRRYIEEALSEDEKRALTQKAIISGLEEIESI